MITIKALKTIERADLVLVPVTSGERSSIAETIIRTHLKIDTVPVVFPMTRDGQTRDAKLREQLEELRPRWAKAESVALPVIGDSGLYATAAYFYDVWRTIEPSVELELVPGVSAHSLVGARAGRFLALGESIFSVIPGTARPETIASALLACDSAALYKPSALKGELRSIVESAGPWSEIVRADRAGLPGERFSRGDEVFASDEYLSTLLLWKPGQNSKNTWGRSI